MSVPGVEVGTVLVGVVVVVVLVGVVVGVEVGVLVGVGCGTDVEVGRLVGTGGGSGWLDCAELPGTVGVVVDELVAVEPGTDDDGGGSGRPRATLLVVAVVDVVDSAVGTGNRGAASLTGS